MLGLLTAVGLMLYGTERTGDSVHPPASAASPARSVTVTPREAISQAYGYDVGACLLVYQSEGGATYICSRGVVASIGPGGTVTEPTF